MQSNLAPIGISTYSRINHLKKTIEALQNNKLAIESELYIFSDAPKAGDEVIVNEVRKYIHTITGFKEIYIIERNTNGRVNNNRGGIKYLLDTYGKCIFMEDDIVTAPGFLCFVNEALNVYENNDNILSITGYSPPLKISNSYQKDFFTLRRFNGWGAAFWKNKYDKIEQNLNKLEVEKKLKDITFLKKLISQGTDILLMLNLEIEDKIDALDVKIMYQQVLNNWYTIYPKKSLVQNIGHDGSGVHCGITDKFHHNELWNKTDNFVFIEDIKLNKNIIKANFDFRFQMNTYTKSFIIDNLLENIKKSKFLSFSIYGIGELTTLLLIKISLHNLNKKINFLIDSNSTTNNRLYYNGFEVITPQEAINLKEKNFVLVSWNNKEIMKKTLNNIKDNLNIIHPEII